MPAQYMQQQAYGMPYGMSGMQQYAGMYGMGQFGQPGIPPYGISGGFPPQGGQQFKNYGGGNVGYQYQQPNGYGSGSASLVCVHYFPLVRFCIFFFHDIFYSITARLAMLFFFTHSLMAKAGMHCRHARQRPLA